MTDDSCHGDSQLDEIITISITSICLIFVSSIAVSAHRNLKEIKNQNKTLRVLLYSSICCGGVQLLCDILVMCICILTHTVAFYISWVPTTCYALLTLFILATLIV